MATNRNVYWFKTKRYGFGWYPAKTVGWFVLAGYFGLGWVIAALTVLRKNVHASDVLVFSMAVLILTVALVVVVGRKGEPPRWRWGK